METIESNIINYHGDIVMEIYWELLELVDKS